MGSRYNFRQFMSVLLLVLFLLPGCSDSDRFSETDYKAVITTMQNQIREGMARDHVAGLSIALVDNGVLVWAEGFGFADEDRHIPATPETVFEIGSISKTFTATVVMRLVERGLMNLDRTLVDYLPGFSVHQAYPGSGPITLRKCMTHHSGIPGDIFVDLFSTHQAPGFRQWMLNCVAQDYTQYPVNYFWCYSNTAMYFLGEAAGLAAGDSFTDLGNQLLEELDMGSSSFTLTPGVEEALSIPYYFNDQTAQFEPLPHFICNAPATGGIYSSVLDMAKYIRMVLDYGYPVLSAKSMGEMRTVQNGNVPLDTMMKQGLNWFLSDPSLDYAGQVMWHSGDTVANHAILMVLPDQGLGVVVLSNSDTSNPLVNQTARKTMQLAVEAKTDLAPPAPPVTAFSPQVFRTKAQLEPFEGIYALHTGAGWDTLTATDGELLWKQAGQNGEESLVPLENGFFANPGNLDPQWEFTEISDRFLMVRRSQGRRGIYGQRYKPEAIPAAWAARLGTWEAINLPPTDALWFVPESLGVSAVEIVLKIEDGMLVVDYPTEGSVKTYILSTFDDDRAVLFGLGRTNGANLRAKNTGGTEELVLLGVEYKKN